MKKLKAWFLQLEGTMKAAVVAFTILILTALVYLVYDAVNEPGFQWQVEGNGTLLLILFWIVVIVFGLWKSANSKGK